MRKNLVLVPLMIGALAAPAGWASQARDTIPLPDDFQPEGIAVGARGTFYVGSLNDGDIYRGKLSTGRGRVFIDVTGRQAAGLKVHRKHHLLFVAGAFDGHGYVYSTRTGATVKKLRLRGRQPSMINDVALTRRAAYFTDSFHPRIHRVPIGPEGKVGRPSTIRVTGPAGASDPGTFGLNGIVALNRGRTLLVDHSELGILATVNPRTGASHRVRLTQGELVAGALDGLARRRHRVWVVQNGANSIAVVRLSDDLRRGRVVRTITDPAFQVPTTVALHRNLLAAVNARFDLGFPPPVGPGAPPGTSFDVVVVRVG